MTDTLLLDASVWLAVLDSDDINHVAAKRLVEASGTGAPALAALDLTLYEIANVAVRLSHDAAVERFTSEEEGAHPA